MAIIKLGIYDTPEQKHAFDAIGDGDNVKTGAEIKQEELKEEAKEKPEDKE